MSTRCQKRKSVQELMSGEVESSSTRNSENFNLDQVSGPSGNSQKIRNKNLDAINSSVRTKTMTDLAKMLAENQKELFNLIAPTIKKKTKIEIVPDTDSEEENISPVIPSSTPVKSGKFKPKSKNDPIFSPNKRDWKQLANRLQLVYLI